jgi:hypothetical protein
MYRQLSVHISLHQEIQEQAGAELCQAQDKLGLAKPALPIQFPKNDFISNSQNI